MLYRAGELGSQRSAALSVLGGYAGRAVASDVPGQRRRHVFDGEDVVEGIEEGRGGREDGAECEPDYCRE